MVNIKIKKHSLRHFLKLNDLNLNEIYYIFQKARLIKNKFVNCCEHITLKNKTLAMIFEKASTRTRVSFEAGIYQMGGHAINLTLHDSQLGRSETIEDTAQVLSRMVDIIMLRTFEQTRIERFAQYSRVPVINGLTDDYHPCQILTDIFTYLEHRDNISNKIVAWIGDSNNMAYTWLQAAEILGFTLHVSTPPGYEMDSRKTNNIPSKIFKQFSDPYEACKGAHIINTDVWTSMGFEKENNKRRIDFKNWRVNEKMISVAHSDVIFMHCLPAHRGEEVESNIIDGSKSVVWDEASNRLHVQKALMEFLLIG
ncbi:MAG: ornithine carbamoyltransferase [Bordetella sp.]|nr:MAG: ornithine carbamoyltransferase [Bordetella sp.]